MNKNKIGDHIIVKWRDSGLYLSQCEKDDKFEINVVISSGFLIQEDKDMIVLSGDVIVNNSSIRRVISIPKENIVNE